MYIYICRLSLYIYKQYVGSICIYTQYINIYSVYIYIYSIYIFIFIHCIYICYIYIHILYIYTQYVCGGWTPPATDSDVNQMSAQLGHERLGNVD